MPSPDFHIMFIKQNLEIGKIWLGLWFDPHLLCSLVIDCVASSILCMHSFLTVYIFLYIFRKHIQCPCCKTKLTFVTSDEYGKYILKYRTCYLLKIYNGNSWSCHHIQWGQSIITQIYLPSFGIQWFVHQRNLPSV